MSLYDKAKFIFSGKAGAGGRDVLYNIKPALETKAEELIKHKPDSTNWALGTGITVVDEEFVFTEVIRYQRARSLYDVFETGKKYHVSFEVEDFDGDSTNPNTGRQSGGELRVQQVDNINLFDYSIVKSGKYSATFTAQTYTDSNGDSFTNTGIVFKVVNGEVSCKIKNISVKEVRVSNNDFEFTRDSNLSATRFRQDGLIEKGRENMFRHSNEFARWSKDSAIYTVSQGGFLGYDGTNNAWLINKTTDANSYIGNQTHDAVDYTGVFTWSMYAKQKTSGSHLFMYTPAGAASFNLATGQRITNSSSNIHSYMEAVPGNSNAGWYKCVLTTSGSITTSDRPRFKVCDDTGGNATGEIYVMDAQLEVGLHDSEFIKTDGNIAKFGAAGVLEKEPRYDYEKDVNGDPSLLIEPNRKNYVVYSEHFGASNWNVASQTKNSTFTYMPDEVTPTGSKGVWKYTADTTGDQLGTVPSGALSVGDVVTNSIFVKRAGGQSTITITFRGVNNVVDSTHTLTDADGWKRITATATCDGTPSIARRHCLNLGTANDSILVWGAQQEDGQYASSYIPNHGTSSGVTRVSEVAKLRDMNLGTSYTVLFDFDATDNLRENTVLFTMWENQTDDLFAEAIWTARWYKTGNSGNEFRVYDQRGTAYPVVTTYGSSTKKWVMRVDGTSFDFFQNEGGTPTKRVGNPLSGTRYVDRFEISAQKSLINNLVFFDSALTDAECESLIT